MKLSNIELSSTLNRTFTIYPLILTIYQLTIQLVYTLKKKSQNPNGKRIEKNKEKFLFFSRKI